MEIRGYTDYMDYNPTKDNMNDEDLGLLEHGMTFKDKEDLLNIVRMSENTAQAEEDERKSKVTGISSPGISNQREGDMLENGEVKERGAVENDLEITQVYFPSDVVMKLSNSLDKSSNPDLTADVEEPKSSSKENQKSYSLPLEADSVEDDDVLTYEEKSENEKNDLLKGETCVNQTRSDNFSSLSSDKEQEHIVSTQQNHDREKSLDVFSYNQEPFLKTFCRSKLRKAQERIPFYLLHRNMDVNKYTNFFKCYINEYLRRLYRNQRRRLEHLEWGPPICMDDSSVSDFKKQKLREESDSARRYNFRDRLVKPKIIDFASENSEEAEEESNDEDIFTPRNKKLPGIKLSSKRKISSMNDVISPKKEKKDLNSVFESKKLQDASVGDVPSKIEVLHEETPTINANDVGSYGVFSKRVPRTKLNITSRKRNRRQGLTSSSQVKEDMELTENAEITSTTELDVPVSRDEENIEPREENEMNIELKPVALSAKHKKVLMTYDKSIRPLRRKTEVENSRDEFSYFTDSETPSQDMEPKIPCPICRSLFPAKCIEEHASDCNQYHSDISAELNRDK
ncbi:uncharacterized protein [Anabrus simplex]|uniref:uncharacterized protein isoform X3 n=1 Tax=Anabrus simplex TaxID=316456 RepID=UPI0035A31140